jgi:hypothetical protein
MGNMLQSAIRTSSDANRNGAQQEQAVQHVAIGTNIGSNKHVLAMAAAAGAKTVPSREHHGYRSTEQVYEERKNNAAVVIGKTTFTSVRRRLPVQEKSVMNGKMSAPLSTVIIATVVPNEIQESKSIVLDNKKSRSKTSKSSKEKQQEKLLHHEIAIAEARVSPNQEDVEAANELIQFVKASAALDKISVPSSFATSTMAETLTSLPHHTFPSSRLPREVTVDSVANTYSKNTYTAFDTKKIDTTQIISVPTVQRPIPVPPVLANAAGTDVVALDLSDRKGVSNDFFFGKPSVSINSDVAPVVPTLTSFDIAPIAVAVAAFLPPNKPPTAPAVNGQQVQIKDPLPTDVLCGQDKTFSKHYGNQLLRMKIIETVPKYQDILRIPSVIGKKKKATEMYKDIVTQMKASGSRFLRLVQSSCGLVRYWQEINDKLARDKVSHALRTYMKKYVTGNSNLHGGACADGSSYRNFTYLTETQNSTENNMDVDIDDSDDDLDKQIRDINKRWNQDILRQHVIDGSNRMNDNQNDDDRDVVVVSPSQQVSLVTAAASEKKAKIGMNNKMSLPMNPSAYTDGTMSNDDDMVDTPADNDDDETFSYFDDDNIEELEDLFLQQQELLRDMIHQASLPPRMLLVPKYLPVHK